MPAKLYIPMAEVLDEAPTEIMDFVVPYSLPEGSEVNVRILLRNAGVESGHLFVVINGNPTAPGSYMTVEAGTTHPTQVAPGESIWMDLYFRYHTMPGWDFNLTAINYEGTSSISRTIILPAPEPGWVHDSFYRGIEILVWMPDRTHYTAYFDDDWHMAALLSTLQSAIDDFLEPAESYTQITDFIVPTSLPEGAPIGELTVVTRNAGKDAGYLFVGINSDKYTVVAGSSYPIQVAPGDMFTFYLTPEIDPNMPSQDYTLTATNDDGTSQISRTILVEVGIPTITTMSAPDKAGVGEKFNISGILYETEAGIPIPNQSINHSYDGRNLGGSTTGVDGDYLKEVSVPKAGVWTLKSEFPGTETLQASGAFADIVVTATPIVTALQIAGPIVTGLALFIYGLS